MIKPHTLSPATRRLVWLLRMICFAMLVLFVVLIVLLLIAPDALVPDDPTSPIAVLPPGPWRGIAIAYGLAMLVPPIWGTLALMRLSGAYLRDQVFTSAPAQHLMTTGAALLATAILKFLSVPLFGMLNWLATVESGARGDISISFGTGELALIGGGLLLRTIGRVLLDAARIADENQSFV